MFELQKKLGDESKAILKKKFAISPDVSFDIPTDEGRGDLTSSIALQLSKKVGKKPQEIAQVLVDGLSSLKGVVRAEIAGPGYVNIIVETGVLVGALVNVWRRAEPAKVRSEAPVIVEYSQPNIAKPLGIHHILSTVIGQVVANLYRHCGYPVISWNYMGDWGTQFGKLSVAYERWGAGKKIETYSVDDLLALYVRFHEEAEKDASLEDQGREAFRKLEAGDVALRAFRNSVVAITKSALEAQYARLQASFDIDYSESFYEDKMEPIIQEGIQKKVFTEGEGGALIVSFPEESKMPPYLIRKGDGATLYSTRDIAQMKFRIDTYHPQTILILTDIAQKLHFEQLVETCNMLGWELPDFENVLFGRMRFADKSMSTRKGNILKLDDVLDEAVRRADSLIAEKQSEISATERETLKEIMGIGAVVYGVLSQNRKMDMVFDWNKVLTFDGNSAPYLQYTHARATSVLRKAGVGGELSDVAYDAALTLSERALLHHLFLFADIVEAARADRMPHKLCQYLYALCQSFNSFYNTDVIVKAQGDVRALRLALTALTAHILKTGAQILTIRVPDRM